MKLIVRIFGGLAFAFGILSLIGSFLMPQMYSLSGASAIQVTQIYTQAIHLALIGIGCILVAILIDQTSIS